MTGEDTFCEYYSDWLSIYKEGAVRSTTMSKYRMSEQWLYRLIPDLKLKDMTKSEYQKMINEYAKCHEKQTTMDFHHQVKAAVLDAVDEGLIPMDITRRVVIKGTKSRAKKKQYLSKVEVQKLVEDLNLTDSINFDWLILLIIKTGLRFSEAVAITPADFDYIHQTLSVNKTLDYKNGVNFEECKNASSKRVIKLDYQICMQFFQLTHELPYDKPIFLKGDGRKIYNATVNDLLEQHCRNAQIPVVSIHGLRHTHASVLLCGGVSILSVSRRLGHSSVDITQKVYLHIIRELEAADTDKIMKELTSIIV